MKNYYFCILFLILFNLNCTAQESAGKKGRFSKMSSQRIDSLLTDTATKKLSVTEKMNFYSEYFLDTPYSFTCVGDGENALLEKYPLVNFQETNCMAYCEHVLALSISDSWDNFFNNLQQIRYKDGIIGMRTRNHYTMADWLPENDWLLDDVSAKVGGEYTKQVTRTISHTKFFQGKGISDLRYVIPDREITLDYIPKAALLKIKDNLKVGDIGSLFFADKTDIFSAHMFMVVEDENGIFIRESSNSKMSTFDTNYEKWVKKIQNSDRYIGIAVMRVRAEINTIGKIIVPWEIAELKKSVRGK